MEFKQDSSAGLGPGLLHTPKYSSWGFSS
jgi:hypothetical protein